LSVQEEEMLCSDFFEILPLYVHLQLAGKEVENLHQCPECNEVYQALLKAVQSEKDRGKQ